MKLLFEQKYCMRMTEDTTCVVSYTCLTTRSDRCDFRSPFQREINSKKRGLQGHGPISTSGHGDRKTLVGPKAQPPVGVLPPRRVISNYILTRQVYKKLLRS
jgi:hypothetical protein